MPELPPPTAEIVSTGTEILQGLYPDRNAMDLSRLLDAAGFRVRHHHAARDCAADIAAQLAAAAERSDLVVMTGGLGPTEDDLTREAVAVVWQAPVALDPEAERMVRTFFEMRSLPMPERNIVQAMIPQGGDVFYNFHGTAPGFALPPREGLAALVALPGPPKEWKPMWERDAFPWIERRFARRPCRKIASLHVALMPESTLNERLHPLFAVDPRLEMTLLADRGHIRVRLIVTTDDEAEADRLLEAQTREALTRIPPETVLSHRGPEWSIEREIAALLGESEDERSETQRRSIAVAESCTGGMIAARLTDIPGSSRYFRAGFVTYADEAKRETLGVSESILETHGAVSEACVAAMARGARQRTGATAALAVSGVAGPDGGTPDKPVGTVWFALDSADRGRVALRRHFPGDRGAVREWAARQGLDLIRRWAAGLPWPV